MRDLVRLIVWMVVDLFRSWAALEAEILTLRQQMNVLWRTAPKKQTFSSIDRLIFVCLYRLRPGVRDALAIVKPETVVKWHRAGFRLYWRWKLKSAGWQANSSGGNTQPDPRDEHCQSAVGSCVKKTRERHAVRKMKEDPSEPSCRGRLQTAISCFGQKPRW